MFFTFFIIIFANVVWKQPSKKLLKNLFSASLPPQSLGVFALINLMPNYNCTVDALDYLTVYPHDEGINFSITMYSKKDEVDFNSPAIILTEKEVIRLINDLKEFLNNG